MGCRHDRSGARNARCPRLPNVTAATCLGRTVARAQAHSSPKLEKWPIVSPFRGPLLQPRRCRRPFVAVGPERVITLRCRPGSRQRRGAKHALTTHHPAHSCPSAKPRPSADLGFDHPRRSQPFFQTGVPRPSADLGFDHPRRSQPFFQTGVPRPTADPTTRPPSSQPVVLPDPRAAAKRSPRRATTLLVPRRTLREGRGARLQSPRIDTRVAESAHD